MSQWEICRVVNDRIFQKIRVGMRPIGQVGQRRFCGVGIWPSMYGPEETH